MNLRAPGSQRGGGTWRSVHYQKVPHAEVKLVRCTRGGVFDVAVDLRVGSPAFFGQMFRASISMSSAGKKAVQDPCSARVLPSPWSRALCRYGLPAKICPNALVD
jgi:hypothetical protein